MSKEEQLQFLVAPNFNPAVVELARGYGKMVIPGAFTPTEIAAAWESGADLIKVFPATALGPQYLKEILVPLPHIRLVPTGGVTLDNIEQYVAAGASAVAVGSGLVDGRFIRAKDWAGLTENARLYVQAIKRARQAGVERMIGGSKSMSMIEWASFELEGGQ